MEKKTIITGERIEIKGSIPRREIVRKVINTFINTENKNRGKGIKFRYRVENLSINKPLFIIRPGGLQKWNFDFKVEVLEEFGMGKGKHENIMEDFRNKKQENQKHYESLLRILSSIFNCVENDVH